MAIAGAGGTQLQRNRLASSASDREHTKRRSFVDGDVVHTQGAVIVKRAWGLAGVRAWADGRRHWISRVCRIDRPNRARAIVHDGA